MDRSVWHFAHEREREREQETARMNSGRNCYVIHIAAAATAADGHMQNERRPNVVFVSRLWLLLLFVCAIAAHTQTYSVAGVAESPRGGLLRYTRLCTTNNTRLVCGEASRLIWS